MSVLDVTFDNSNLLGKTIRFSFHNISKIKCLWSQMLIAENSCPNIAIVTIVLGSINCY